MNNQGEESLRSTVEHKNRAVNNTNMSVDYNNNVSMVHMLDPGTDHETSGIIEEIYDPKINGGIEIIPEKKVG